MILLICQQLQSYKAKLIVGMKISLPYIHGRANFNIGNCCWKLLAFAQYFANIFDVHFHSWVAILLCNFYTTNRIRTKDCVIWSILTSSVQAPALLD